MEGATVVLGAAVGYSAAQMEPFLRSLRNSGYDGAVALIVDPRLSATLARQPLFRGVTLIGARQWLPVRWDLVRTPWKMKWIWGAFQRPAWWLTRVLGRLPMPEVLRARIRFRLAAFLYPPTETRYFHYERFLARTRFQRVLISDVRDVVFQDDPFRQLPKHGLAVGIETPRITIGAEPWNANWVRWAYGESALDRLRDRPVVCSGVTYGDRDAMLRYLRTITEEIMTLSLASSTTSGIDQGIHNHLVWTGRLGEVAQLRTLHGPLATIGLVPEAELRVRDDGRLQNEDGSLPAIVHQYDRWPALAKRLLPAVTAHAADGTRV